MTQTKCSTHGDLPHLKSGGTFYEFGLSVGTHFRQRIQAYFRESQALHNSMIPFCHTREGRQFLEETLCVTEACFPQYVRECRGIADGAQLPFEHVFMSNVWETHTDTMLKQHAEGGGEDHSDTTSPTDADTGCSTLLLQGEESRLALHTEDQLPLVKEYGYLVTGNIVEGDQRQHFTAFCVPGALPGRAFGVNHHGMVLTSNALCPARFQRGSPGRMFVLRAVLACRTIEDAVRQLVNAPYGSAYGFTANLGTREGAMACVEVAPGRPQACVHVHHLPSPTTQAHYFHFNMYLHLQVAELGPLFSSERRAKRVKELDPPRCRQGALVVAADTQDPQYPIFRTPTPWDTSLTAYTALFDLITNQLALYGDRQQLLTDTPILAIPLWD